MLLLILQVHREEDKHLQSFQLHLFYSSISCLYPWTKGPLSDGRAHYHWEVKAERIRKGQEQGSQLQGNKGKPIPPGIILILETQCSPDSGSMALSGEEKEGGGDHSRILHQRKCATLCPNHPPKLWRILLPVQMF